jgi:hypothetical protein
VNRRVPPWLLLLLLALLCGAVIAGVAWRRGRTGSTAALLSRLPSDGAVILYVDFKALRQAGAVSVLGASRVSQAPEYRALVNRTGFDYLNDLDSALVSFHISGTYFLLRGRFDWGNLNEYVTSQGGTCHNMLCWVSGSAPDRRISYFPLQRNILALALSRDEYAATQLQIRRPRPPMELPAQPVWSIIPAAALRNRDALPAGTRMFVRALDAANTVVLSATPSRQGLAIRMEASCRGPAEAGALAAELSAVTVQLRALIAREHVSPNPADLSGVLAAGSFESQGAKVIGRWPVQRAFLQSLGGGTL